PGGSFTPYDGHVNPLRLLRALHAGFRQAGGDYRPRARVARIEAVEGGFELRSQAGTFEAGKLVIAAGLATPDLARQVAVEAPIHPVHGQLLITERAAPRLAIPTNIVRQTDEGGFQIGYSNDELGYVTGTRLGVLRDIAHNAVRALPYLAGLRILRTWGALRIMTPDGFPIYARSTEHPGAFVFACHSGVTLAAVHAMICPGWIDGDGIPEEQACFSPERFDVQTTA
ncbi:MAG: FAD-binding oxidoreductase, partial [Alphaproteobacteria bacterium]|nr:FAD-binding oxidoreductase [Alphaproteobacteria bacterium]